MDWGCSILIRLYYGWLLLTGSASLYIVVTFWPNYLDNEFPLFTDLTVFILFIPCFYLLGTGIPSQIIWQLAHPPLLQMVMAGVQLCRPVDLGDASI